MGLAVGTEATVSCKGFRFPAEIISHAIWLYFRFPLSYREVEELLLVRGIIVSHETIRQWCEKCPAARPRSRCGCGGREPMPPTPRFLRRFDIEHTFRLFKQTLGWTRPNVRTPEAADRWTWLILAVYTQLRLARPLAADLHRPWEKPSPPNRLTPARVRRDFRHLRPQAACPARAPKPSRPGPGRPPGRKNTRPTPRYDVHTVRKPDTAKQRTKKSTTPPPRRTG